MNKRAYVEMIIWFSVILSLFNFLDGLTTYIGLETGIAEEMNPFAKPLEDKPHILFGIKIFISSWLLIYSVYLNIGKEQLINRIDITQKKDRVVMRSCVSVTLFAVCLYIYVVHNNLNVIYG